MFGGGTPKVGAATAADGAGAATATAAAAAADAPPPPPALPAPRPPARRSAEGRRRPGRSPLPVSGGRRGRFRPPAASPAAAAVTLGGFARCFDCGWLAGGFDCGFACAFAPRVMHARAGRPDRAMHRALHRPYINGPLRWRRPPAGPPPRIAATGRRRGGAERWARGASLLAMEP